MPGPTYATFGNTTLSRGFDFTFGPGVQPSVCMLYTVPHVQNLPSVATLSLVTVGQETLTFRDCLLEEPRLDAGPGGAYWSLPIKDRRWKWQFGEIRGSYNKRRANATYLREKTPQELAGLLLDAMGEVDYQVDNLPNDARPEVNWDDANPAAELDRLCADLGCIVVLNPFLDRVHIWREGNGVSLPTNGPIQGATYSPVLIAKPKSILVTAGPTLFQATFQTEAVGKDTDGKWKKIDDLSYKPTNGWNFASSVAGFPEIGGTYIDGNGRTLYKRDLARATVYQCYRISGLSHGGWEVPLILNDNLVPQRRKDLQFFNQLVDEEIGDDGGLRPAEPVAYVKSFAALEDRRQGEESTRYTEGFQFDTARGIIQFNEPQLRFGDDDSAAEADVRFECAFYAGRDGVFDRWETTYELSQVETPPRIVHRPEIQARIILRYSDEINFKIEDTIPDTNQRLGHWGNAALAEYAIRNGGTANYWRLMRIPVDGLTQQVTWSGGGGRPPRTVASQAQRHNRYVPSLNEYRDRLASHKSRKVITEIKTEILNDRPIQHYA